MVMDFRQETVSGLAEQVRSAKVSARELVSHALARIDVLNEKLNAFVAVDGDAALAAASGIDEAVAGGEDPGPLAGIPIGVKDMEDAAGFRTTHGSATREHTPAAGAHSALVERLVAAGCVVVGKTNTPELGWKGDTDNLLFGATRNPWDQARSPGGSSGGSAAAIAAGMVPLATGSDGGGSIRIPSALCGLSGLKPSQGRIPIGGPNPPGWPSLSSKGPMARTSVEVACALDAVIGPDPTDLGSLPMPEPSWTGALDRPHVPMAVAWSPTLGYAPVDAEVRAVCEQAVGVLSDAGARVVEVDTVFSEDPIWAWLTLTNAFLARSVEDFRDTPLWERIDPGLRASADVGLKVTGVELVKAIDECHRLNLRLVRLFHDVRLLVTPATAAIAPLSGQPGVINGAADLNWVRFTYPFNLTRSPAGTVCAGFSPGGLPVGLQLIGPQHGDLVVLRAMAALEQALALDPVAPIEG
ncbi:MAG TPA: amidase family protein [Acidimicrobiales bacterium]|nr:amidase family protein [Acidimicrobiales bacterium]